MKKKLPFIIAMLFALNIHAQNVGIGTATPQSKLEVVGKITADTLALGNAGSSPVIEFNSSQQGRKIVLWNPSNNIHQFDGLSLANPYMGYHVYNTNVDHAFFAGSSATTSSELMRIKGNGNVGIGVSTARNPLSFPNTTGKKISLYPGVSGDVGMGVYPFEFRLHSDTVLADITLGYDNLLNGFTERMRIKGNGNVGIGTNTPRNPLSFPLAFGKKISLFPGTSGDVGMGVYPFEFRIHSDTVLADLTFGYDNIINGFTERMRIKGNGNVGIGTINPTSMLNVNGQITIDQKNFGGYGGLLLKGNIPGNNYPNIAFSVKNTIATDEVAAMIQGDLINNTAGTEAIDLTFLTSNTGLGGLGERMRIKNNGNVGIGTSSPNAPLQFANTGGNRKLVLYETANNDNQFYGFGISGGTLRYQVDATNADHTFFAATSTTTSTELLRIKGNGAIAVSGNTGVAGQVLTSNGSGSAANWQTPISTSNIVSDAKSGTGTVFTSGSTVIDIPSLQLNVTTTAVNSRLLISGTVRAQTFGCSVAGCFPSVSLYLTIDGAFQSGSGIEITANNNNVQSMGLSNFPITVSVGAHIIKFGVLGGANTNSVTVYPSYSTVTVLPL